MGADEGPGDSSAAKSSVTIEQVLDEFRALKAGEGLTPQKMAGAHATLAAMGELHPNAATQHLLDDLADAETDDGRALAWALRADPAIHVGATLDGRRRASGVPENTAKDREKRAVIALFEKWTRSRADWATSVFTLYASALPATAEVKFGLLSVKVRVWRNAGEGLSVVRFELDGPYPPSDVLTLGNRAELALVSYTTAGMAWRLEMWIPSLGDGDVQVVRDHEGQTPVFLRVEESMPDGRATERRFPGADFEGQTAFTLKSPNLDPPCPISWDWTVPEPEYRPTIVFPDERLTAE